MSALSRLERAQVSYRLTDELLISVEEASTLLGVGPQVVIRWIMAGKRGVHLDGMLVSRKWHTSRPAL